MPSARRLVSIVGAGKEKALEISGLGSPEEQAIRHMLAMGYITPNASVVLCCRGSEGGRIAAGAIKNALELKGLGPVEVRELGEDVTGELVEVICEQTELSGGPQGCAVDVTGASALEAGVAVVAGQVLGVSVYCLEQGGVVCLPPLPMKVDERLWLANYRLWRALEKNKEKEIVVRRIPSGIEGLVEVRSGREGFHLRLSPAGRLLCRAMDPLARRWKASRDKAEAVSGGLPELGPWHYGELRGRVEGLLKRVCSELGLGGRCEVVGWAGGRVEVPGGWVEGEELMGAVEVEGHQVIFRVVPPPEDRLEASLRLSDWVVERGEAGKNQERGERK